LELIFYNHINTVAQIHKIKIYSVIKKDELNFVLLYFLNYIRYVNDCKKFAREYPKFSHTTARALAASVESKMATMQHKIFCVREFIKTES
jgi:hypothetical protein